jgi:hypothetical protein
MAEQDNDQRPVKRTRSVEVRVSDEEREAFLERCREQDRSASEVLREAMAHFARSGRIAPSLRSRTMSFTIAASVLALSAAIQSTTLDLEADLSMTQSHYDIYDLNADQRLTLPEYLRAYGSVRRLANDGGDGVLDAHYSGMVFGTLIRAGYRGRASLFFDDGAQIDDACWTALDREMSVALARGFARYDADEDGVVTPQEFAEFQIAQNLRRFDGMDRNGDRVFSVTDIEILRDQIAERRRETADIADATPPDRPIMSPGTFHDDTPEAIRICGPQIDAMARMRPAQPAAEARPETPRRTPQEEFNWAWADADENGDGQIDFSEFNRRQSLVFGPAR